MEGHDARAPDHEGNGHSPLADLATQGERGLSRLRAVTRRVRSISEERLAVTEEEIETYIKDEARKSAAVQKADDANNLVCPDDVDRLRQRLERKLSRAPSDAEVAAATRDLQDARSTLASRLRRKLRREPTREEVLAAELSESQISLDYAEAKLARREGDFGDLTIDHRHAERRIESLRTDKEAMEGRAERRFIIIVVLVILLTVLALLYWLRPPALYGVSGAVYTSDHHIRIGLMADSNGFERPRSVTFDWTVDETVSEPKITRTEMQTNGVLKVYILMPQHHNRLLDVYDLVDEPGSGHNK